MAQPPSRSAATAAPGALPPNAYAEAFVRGQPRESVSRIQGRLHKAKVLADELAEYFAARRELETAYLKALSKMSKRAFLSDPTALGTGFVPVYERLIAEVAEVASVHAELESKIEGECEVPMRSASNRGEWGRVKEHDDNLASTLKEVNLLEAQLQKDQKKLETSSSKKAAAAQAKVSDTQRALSQTLEIWETEAPFAFEAYQRVDEQRLDLLRETVAKFETAQSDAAQRLMNITEQTMQVALSFDTQAEMSEFLLKNATAPAGGRSAPPPAPVRSRRESTPAGGPPVVPSRSTGPPVPPSIRTNGGGAGAGASANEFGAASSSASIHSNGPPTPSEATPGRGSTLKSALTRIGRGRGNKGSGNEPSSMFGSLPDSAEPMGPPSSESRIGSRAPKLSLSNDASASRRDENSSSAGLMAPMQPDAPLSGENSQQSTLGRSAVPQVDAEGYSIPPPDRKPWEVGGAGAPAGGASLMDDDDEDEQEQVADLPSKVTGMNISSKPIAEDSAQDQEALERMRSTLLTARTPAAGPTRRGTTRRDRRDVRNTAYMPGGINVEDAQTQSTLTKSSSAAAGLGGVTSPIPTQSAFAGQPGLGAGRSQSIVSMSSMNAAPGNPFEASNGPGLRASITETVNVIFAGRDVQRIMVVGEVAVSLRDIGTTEPLHLRLDAFEQLEKAAPNPAFLQPLGADKPGEYRLDVAALLAQGGASGAAQATLLKYQLHVSESRQREYIPLDVTAQWRCEATQTSFLCNYSSNPASRLAQPSSADDTSAATLQDLSFVVNVQPSNVTGQMSKPVGAWSAEHKRMYWRIAEDLSLASAESNKVLGRFQVDAPSTPGPVQVRWRVAGRTISALGVSVVADSNVAPSALRFDSVARSTSSGKYVANPV